MSSGEPFGLQTEMRNMVFTCTPPHSQTWLIAESEGKIEGSLLIRDSVFFFPCRCWRRLIPILWFMSAHRSFSFSFKSSPAPLCRLPPRLSWWKQQMVCTLAGVVSSASPLSDHLHLPAIQRHSAVREFSSLQWTAAAAAAATPRHMSGISIVQNTPHLKFQLKRISE